MLPHRLLEKQLREAVRSAFPDADLSTISIRPCPDTKFGDYQTASLMALAKARRLNPRQVAATVLAGLDVTPWCESAEIAGAGFVTFRLKRSALVEALAAAARGEHLFFERVKEPRTMVVDFSSPNVAKPMHVGHIRSTILGDGLARLFRLLGHRVITDNHLGDWGTQFGKLLVGWKKNLDPRRLEADPLGEMERLYKMVNEACETQPATLEEARTELVHLQRGDPENLGIWREMIALSSAQFDRLYRRLDVRFDHTLGESFYNPALQGVVERLRAAGLAQESEGAIAVFFPDVPELKGQPALIQKSDGAFNYTTTDLATLEYRMQQWRPQSIYYVTDGRQQLHFKQLFTIFRRWHPDLSVHLEHVWFGAILGEDGRPFKTRSGDTIRLADLLDEAEERALAVVSAKNPDLGESERKQIARIVGIGAIKYADLLPNRQSDYVFSWDKMLALHGNTAPYLLYAYTRIRSIFRRLHADQSVPWAWAGGTLELDAPEEVALAKRFLNFDLVLQSAAEECRPNYLCNYLYELAGTFTSFYESCPVLKAEGPARDTRLALCDLTGQILKTGLETLGLETAERM